MALNHHLPERYRVVGNLQSSGDPVIFEGTIRFNKRSTGFALTVRNNGSLADVSNIKNYGKTVRLVYTVDGQERETSLDNLEGLGLAPLLVKPFYDILSQQQSIGSGFHSPEDRVLADLEQIFDLTKSGWRNSLDREYNVPFYGSQFAGNLTGLIKGLL